MAESVYRRIDLVDAARQTQPDMLLKDSFPQRRPLALPSLLRYGREAGLKACATGACEDSFSNSLK